MINAMIQPHMGRVLGSVTTSTTTHTTTVEEAGCLNHFNKVQECMTKNQDWHHDKKCEVEVEDFRECYQTVTDHAGNQGGSYKNTSYGDFEFESDPTDCFDYEQRFYYTIFFVLLSPLFWLFEFLTLTWEPTGLRKQIKV